MFSTTECSSSCGGSSLVVRVAIERFTCTISWFFTGKLPMSIWSFFRKNLSFCPGIRIGAEAKSSLKFSFGYTALIYGFARHVRFTFRPVTILATPKCRIIPYSKYIGWLYDSVTTNFQRTTIYLVYQSWSVPSIVITQEVVLVTILYYKARLHFSALSCFWLTAMGAGYIIVNVCIVTGSINSG